MSQKNKRFLLKGKCMYACVQEARPTFDAKNSGGPDKEYSIFVECDEGFFQQLQKAGIHPSTKLREFEGDSSKYLKLKKTAIKKTKDGRVIEFDPLPVKDRYGRPLDAKVGNGSEVECVVEMAPVGNIKALRLQLVKVVDLVEYIDNNDFSDVISFEQPPEEDSIGEVASPEIGNNDSGNGVFL